MHRHIHKYSKTRGIQVSKRAEQQMKKMETIEETRGKADIKVTALQSIRLKIMMLVAAAAILVGALMIVLFSDMSKKEFKDLVLSYMYDLAEAYDMTINVRLENLAAQGLEPETAFWEQIVGDVSIKDMDGAYAYIVANDGTMCYHPTAEKIGKPVENKVVSNVVAQLQAGNVPNKPEAVEYEFNGAVKYAAYSVTDGGDYIFVITADEKEAMSAATETVVYCATRGMATVLICVIIAFFVCNIIVKPIRRLTDMAMRIAGLDFRENEEQKKLGRRKDEIGAMGRAVDILRKQLAAVIVQITQQSNVLFDASEQMNSKAEKVSSTVKQVDCAVQEIAEGATSQAEETQKATQNVVVMGNMIEESNSEMETLRDNARNMRSSSKAAAETLDTLDEVNQKTSQAMEVIYNQTNTTNESALKIREATTLITSIAEETNLLSLNATIEAARAGEQGRGFAVVAGQIQKLAEQSNESARQIEEIINLLISDSQKAVETMDETKRVMELQNQNVAQTRDKFMEVQEGIGKTIDGIRSIAGRMEQLDTARINVVDVVQSLTAIAQENAAGSEETSAAVTEVGNHMLGIAENSGELKKIADRLEQEMKAFRV